MTLTKKFLQIVTLSFILGMMASPAAASSDSSASARNADANAMIYNGAYSKAELLQKLHNGDGIHSATQLQHEYHSRGASLADIQSPNTVNGIVTRTGNVLVGDKVVATGATSYGRCNNGACSTTQLYNRPTSTSFQTSELAAYVVMKSGKFQYAIIKSCGNLVRAIPKMAPRVVAAKPVVHTQIITQPAPPVTVVQANTQTVVNQQTVKETVQQVSPAPQPVPVSTVKYLPVTGSSPIAALALTAIGLGLWYLRRSKQALKSALVNR